jgi:hypothetical protein
MAQQWTRLECEAIVADYLAMLYAECRGEPYSKADHRRKLNNNYKIVLMVLSSINIRISAPSFLMPITFISGVTNLPGITRRCWKR